MTLKVPTIFSAVDKVSKVVTGIKHSIHSFAGSAQTGVARGERLFRKFTPALSETAKQFLSVASAAAIAASVIAGLSFTVKQIREFESALASFRTIVGGTDEEFNRYRVAALEVGTATRKSSVEVIKSFESIAALNAEFAKSPEAISQMSKAVIILSKGSGDALDVSAQNLVGIMNQYKFGAEEADRVVNVLAAGQAVGAASITQTADAFTVFGSSAKSANITIEESVGLIQTLGKGMILGSEAGTALRASIALLQKAGFGYKSGQFQINEALEEAKKKYDALATAKQKDAFVMKTFGIVNLTTGKTLLDNIDTFKAFTSSVKGTDEGLKAATIKSATLDVKLQELSATWVNMVLASDKSTSGLAAANAVVEFLIVNLGIIVSIGTKVLLFFIAWKAILIVTKIALVAYNIALGITGALSSTASIAIGRSAIALGTYKTVTALATAAQWALNVAMTANPIGIIVVAIVAAIAVIALMIVKWNEWGAALSFVLGPLGLVISLIQSFRRNWDIIKESFENKGFVAGIKAIGSTIHDALIMPVQQLLEIIGKLTGSKWISDTANKLKMLRSDIGVNVTTDESGRRLTQNKVADTSYNNLSQMTPGTSPIVIDKSVLNGESGGSVPKVAESKIHHSFGSLFNSIPSQSMDTSVPKINNPVPERIDTVNPKSSEREMIREEIRSQTYNSKLTIHDQTGRAKMESDDPNIALIQAKVGSTMQR